MAANPQAAVRRPPERIRNDECSHRGEIEEHFRMRRFEKVRLHTSRKQAAFTKSVRRLAIKRIPRSSLVDPNAGAKLLRIAIEDGLRAAIVPVGAQKHGYRLLSLLHGIVKRLPKLPVVRRAGRRRERVDQYQLVRCFVADATYLLRPAETVFATGSQGVQSGCGAVQCHTPGRTQCIASASANAILST